MGAAELERFAAFCSELRVENRQPMRLYPEQRWMLSDYFDGVRETLILVPKKNGKTSLLAALAIYHLIVTPDAECVVAAASRDQAAILLRQAQGFIDRTPSLKALMRVKQREIVSLSDAGRIRVLASDSDTADGVIPTLALVDELHRHKDDGALYGVFYDGLEPRDGQLVTISTAGDHEESPLGRLRAAAYSLGVRREGAYRYARSADFAMHEWALSPEEDREDMSLVARANPAPWWQDVEALRRRRESPSMTETRWARFACGVWMRGEDSAIAEHEWAALPHGEIPEGTPVRVGVDFGWKHDTTALVPFWLESQHRRVFGTPIILTPPRDGTALKAAVVQAAFQEIAERNPIEAVCMDASAGGLQFAEWLEAAPEDDGLGVQVIEVPQSNQVQAAAYALWMEAVREGWIAHPHDPEFTRHVLNAIAKPISHDRYRFDRPNPSRHAAAQDRRVIDALIAAAGVHWQAVAGLEPEPPPRPFDVADYRLVSL